MTEQPTTLADSLKAPIVVGSGELLADEKINMKIPSRPCCDVEYGKSCLPARAIRFHIPPRGMDCPVSTRAGNFSFWMIL